MPSIYADKKRTFANRLEHGTAADWRASSSTGGNTLRTCCLLSQPHRPSPSLSSSYDGHFISSTTTTPSKSAAANISASLDDDYELARQRLTTTTMMMTMNNDINRGAFVPALKAARRGSSAAFFFSWTTTNVKDNNKNHINIHSNDVDRCLAVEHEIQQHSPSSSSSAVRAFSKHKNNSGVTSSACRRRRVNNNNNNLSFNNNSLNVVDGFNHFGLPVFAGEAAANSITTTKSRANAALTLKRNNIDTFAQPTATNLLPDKKRPAELAVTNQLRNYGVAAVCCAALTSSSSTTAATTAASVALPASSLGTDRSYYDDHHVKSDFSSVLNRQRQQQLFVSFQNQSSSVQSQATTTTTVVAPVFSPLSSSSSPAVIPSTLSTPSPLWQRSATVVNSIFKSAANSIIDTGSSSTESFTSNYFDDDDDEHDDEKAHDESDYDQVDNNYADQKNVITFDVQQNSPASSSGGDDYSVVLFPSETSKSLPTTGRSASDTYNGDGDYRLTDWNLFSSSSSTLPTPSTMDSSRFLSSKFINQSFPNSSNFTALYDNDTYSVHHDAGEQQQYELSPLIIALGVIYAAIIVTSFFGNLLVVLAVLKSHKLRSITHYLLMWLAVADLTVTVSF